MIHKQTTKELLAESTFDLLKSKTIDQITVQDIIDNCGMSRKTFYNHFMDKQALFEWTYSRDVLSLFSKIGPSYTLKDAILDTLIYLKDNLRFFSKLREEKLVSVYQTHFIEAMKKQIRDMGIEMDEDLLFMINYTGVAQVSMVSRWIGSGAKESPQEIVRLLLMCFPDRLCTIFELFPEGV